MVKLKMTGLSLAAIAAFCVLFGIAIGAALHLPGMSAPFDNDTATLLGSVLGALLGASLPVIGAEVIAYRRRSDKTGSARGAITSMIHPLQRAVREMFERSDSLLASDDQGGISQSIDRLQAELYNFESFWKEAKPICADLGADGLISYVGIQREIGNISGYLVHFQEYRDAETFHARLSDLRLTEAALNAELARVGIRVG